MEVGMCLRWSNGHAIFRAALKPASSNDASMTRCDARTTRARRWRAHAFDWCASAPRQGEPRAIAHCRALSATQGGRVPAQRPKHPDAVAITRVRISRQPVSRWHGTRLNARREVRSNLHHLQDR
jgi:hypothetical protein